MALAVLGACTNDSPTEPTEVLAPSAAVVPADNVDDLRVTATTDSTVTLSWTQVHNGAGKPANYRLKYAPPAINWSTATVGCTPTILGTAIGASMSCTVRGLTVGTTYDFELMSFRVVRGGAWAGAVYSNVATGTTTAAPADAVDDLAIAAATNSTLTVRWTQVDDGTGTPASYRVKHAAPPIAWSGAQVGCGDVVGTQIGAATSCTITGLSAATAYDVQLMSYRVVDGVWQGAVYSNVATGVTATPNAAPVTDLSVSAVTDSSLTVRWTQVGDGAGSPASYSVKYARPSLVWSTATVGCNPTPAATQIGATLSCTVRGLAASTGYEVQVMSYRGATEAPQGAAYSNLAAGQTAAVSVVGGSGGAGIWIDKAALMQRPTSGAEWDKLLADAARDYGIADISNQDSNHDVYTLAGALVCVRTGQHCAKARQAVLAAIGTESGARWLAVGRNLGAYVIAADLLNLRDDGVGGSDGTRVQQWMRGWLTKRLSDNNDASLLRPFGPFHSGANAAAQEGFAYAAVAAYLRDAAALERAWQAFRTFACDSGALDVEDIYLTPIVSDGWAHTSLSPCAVNPRGTNKLVPLGLPGGGSSRRLDGSLGGDMRRGGVYQWVPGYTSYPWVGLEGFVPAAVILHRTGYPAFEAADRAVLRTHEYLRYLATSTGDVRWFDGVRSREIVHLVNVAYGASFPVAQVVGGGRTIGYTRWSHSSW